MLASLQDTILKWLLLAGALYFLAVAVVHSAGLKVPGLFVYYNVPSYSYQDRIISCLAFGWSSLFYLAGRQPRRDLLLLILTIGLVAILALAANTIFTDFYQLSPLIHKGPFLIINLLLFIYWVLLVVWGRPYIFHKQG